MKRVSSGTNSTVRHPIFQASQPVHSKGGLPSSLGRNEQKYSQITQGSFLAGWNDYEGSQ